MEPVGFFQINYLCGTVKCFFMCDGSRGKEKGRKRETVRIVVSGSKFLKSLQIISTTDSLDDLQGCVKNEDDGHFCPEVGRQSRTRDTAPRVWSCGEFIT